MSSKEVRRQSLSHLSPSTHLENALATPSHKPTRSLILGHRPKPKPLKVLARNDSVKSQALMKGLQLMARLYGPVPREREEIEGKREEVPQPLSSAAPYLPPLHSLPAIQSPLSSTCKNSTLAALQDFEVGSRRLSRFGHNRSTSGTWNPTGRLSLQPTKSTDKLSLSQHKLNSPEVSLSSQSVHSRPRLFQFPPMSHQSTL